MYEFFMKKKDSLYIDIPTPYSVFFNINKNMHSAIFYENKIMTERRYQAKLTFPSWAQKLRKETL